MTISKAAMFTAAAIASTALSAPVKAQDTAIGLGIELNKLETTDGGCLSYIVLRNGLTETLDSLVLDLYTFDANGIIGENLPVQLAPVPGAKTTVKAVQFATACEGIAQILVSAIPACNAAGAPLEGCAAAIELSSRADVAFEQ